MANLPYLAAPGSIKNALDRIRTAATPDRVTGDFVTTKLQLKGGTGAAIPPFLKKIGFVASDGTPTDLYKRFRNQSTAGAAVAEAIRIGYKPLAEANEYFYDLSDKDLLALILQVTGAEAESVVAKQTLGTLRNLKSFADFEAKPNTEAAGAPGVGDAQRQAPLQRESDRRGGLNLSYTINLNLPATTDQAVFNAIFRSLREHLLSDE
jgi:hypothetical protein